MCSQSAINEAVSLIGRPTGTLMSILGIMIIINKILLNGLAIPSIAHARLEKSTLLAGLFRQYWLQIFRQD